MYRSADVWFGDLGGDYLPGPIGIIELGHRAWEQLAQDYGCSCGWCIGEEA